MNKLGFFLGSFDPPHIGHLQVAIECLNNKLVDKVIYVPAKQNPFKENSLNIYERINMLNCMISEYNLKDLIEVSYVECDFERDNERVKCSYETSDNNQVKYSYEILDTLFNKLYKDYDCYWILTTETFETLPLWKHYDKLKGFKKLIGYNIRPYYYHFEHVIKEMHIIDYFKIYNTPHSSDLRKFIKDNKNPYPFISKTVFNYIKQHNLYI